MAPPSTTVTRTGKTLAVLWTMLALIWCAIAPTAAADFYAGLGAGDSSIGFDGGQVTSTARAAGFSSAQTGVDKNDTGYKLFLGQQCTNRFAVEAVYTGLGKTSFHTVTSGAAATKSSLRVAAWSVDALRFFPTNNNFAFFAKAGLYRWRINAGTTQTAGGVGVRVAETGHGTNYKLGLGARYHMARNTVLRAEFENFNNLGHHSEGDIRLLSLGVGFNF